MAGQVGPQCTVLQHLIAVCLTVLCAHIILNALHSCPVQLPVHSASTCSCEDSRLTDAMPQLACVYELHHGRQLLTTTPSVRVSSVTRIGSLGSAGNTAQVLPRCQTMGKTQPVPT